MSHAIGPLEVIELERKLQLAIDLERWAKGQHDAGNPMGVLGMSDAIVEQILISDEIEEARQARIAAGEEMVCRVCGCSDTRACPGGCYWAAPGLCSKCAEG
ncbi:MAG: hypothetical protein ABFD89_29445 [Bryobacteraceae bacterium]